MEHQVMTNGKHLTVYQDPENDYALYISGARTLKTYHKLAYDTHPNCYEYRCFYAFGNEQFQQGCRNIHLDTEHGEKVVNGGSGLYGTEEGLRKYFAFYDDLYKQIAEQCDPEEVYYYEYNNFECCLDWDGDERAICRVIKLFGADAARKIHRLRAFSSIDALIKS